MNTYHKNPRLITEQQKADLKSWIDELGDISGIVVDNNSREIISGNQRSDVVDLDNCVIDIKTVFDEPTKQGTISEGIVITPSQARLNYRLVDWTPEQCEKANIIANKAGGTWNWDILETQFHKEDLIEWGFDESEFGIGVDETVVTTGDDDVPEVQDEAETVKGDLWELGNHRLLCGDSTMIDDVEKLMGGERADFSFCDPPYNLGFEYNTYDDNKTVEEYDEFSRLWFGNICLYSDRQAITLGTKNIKLMAGLGDVSGVACWVKKNWITSCHIAKLQQWEPIFFFGDYTKKKRVSDLYEVNRKYQDDVGDSHSCPKQIELIVDIFENYCDSIILDLFGGSGTSLIAALKTNKTSFLMELDEKYCDVIAKRYIKFCKENNKEYTVKLNGNEYTGKLLEG